MHNKKDKFKDSFSRVLPQLLLGSESPDLGTTTWEPPTGLNSCGRVSRVSQRRWNPTAAGALPGTFAWGKGFRKTLRHQGMEIKMAGDGWYDCLLVVMVGMIG